MSKVAMRNDVYSEANEIGKPGTSVEVRALYRGVLIGTRHLDDPAPPSRLRKGRPDPRTSYLVGSSAEVDAPAPPEVIGGESLPLVSAWGPGYMVNTTPAMHGEFEIGGKLIRLEDYVRERGRSFALPEAGNARIECGSMSFLVGRTARPARVPRPWWSLRWNEQRYTLGSVLALALLLAVAVFVPPEDVSISGELTTGQATRIMSTITPPERQEIPEWLKKPDRGDEGQAHQGESGVMGDKKAIARNKRYAIKGDARPEERSLDKNQAIEVAKNAGVLGVLNRVEGSAPSSIFSRSSAVGSDPENVLSNLIGTEIGSAYGIGGLGVTGSGPGGGGFGMNTVGLGRFATLGKGGIGKGGIGYGTDVGRLQRRINITPEIIPGTANVHGSLDKEIVRRIIRRHMNEVKFCYEGELGHKPELAGRISINFMIAGNGQVIASMLQSSTMSNARVESCVVNAAKRWEFPRPVNGGMVQVVYPFNFAPAGG